MTAEEEVEIFGAAERDFLFDVSRAGEGVGGVDGEGAVEIVDFVDGGGEVFGFLDVVEEAGLTAGGGFEIVEIDADDFGFGVFWPVVK